ncbi:MAG: hypothetical protein ISR52_04095 [Rhodospirillales bacterium]|nr:hypothetical protein [Rhodospirillales bacterium]
MKALVSCVVAPAWFKTCTPAALLTVSSPTVPLASGSREMVFCSPSAAAVPATVVPRMPMLATGVLMTMASGLDLAIWPLTKVKTPCTTEVSKVPVLVPGS